jgi:hypothetical protein
MPSSNVEQIKERLDIVDVISSKPSVLSTTKKLPPFSFRRQGKVFTASGAEKKGTCFLSLRNLKVWILRVL